MATILLSAAGAALGGTLGGSVLGMSSVVAGRFVGAVLGRAIDQRLMGQGAEPVETGRVERIRLMGAGEGDPIARIHGRMRVAGQVIWASQFREVVSESGGGGGKGLSQSASPAIRNYSYRVSLAVALCEGEISGIGRVWADGAELAPEALGLRVYTGAVDQLPDPKIEAVEGAGSVPAYRGTAYVVLEELNLDRWGNRVPQFTFEVLRPAPAEIGPDDPARAIQAVAMMPGSGEYALATTPVSFDLGAGVVRMANVNTPSGKADFPTALDQMEASLPACQNVSLIVSWFGNDLRCGECATVPRLEQNAQDGTGMPWSVSGVTRPIGLQVPRDDDDRPVYGGTPSDASVVEAIREMNARGQKVMFYPFLLMDQMPGNTLTDPWTGEEGQPELPWRGRITTSLAPGVDGSPDRTAQAAAEVDAFFGTAAAADYVIGDGLVSHVGSPDWQYRHFILHYAALCAAAGGVDSFCIGSEMRALTQIRDDSGFPAVAAFRDLAAEVRTILGPNTKIGYAADWSEYFGYQPQDGSGDRYFHLDPLWSDAEIDFIGIDNYMPLSDWRDSDTHADAHWGDIYDLDYLRANIEGGEGYDWFYHSPEAEAAQIRTPITDDAHGEPWIWRYKDIRNWWASAHHERIDGVRQELPTGWEPQSKPIWFTELGCAAIDKATNQPNKFLDPKSSESQLPRASDGRRDDLIQLQYLRAMYSHWGDPANNPVSVEYGGPMIDMSRGFVWAWDARPFPWFPRNREIWSDGANYTTGHWITGRASARSLASVVREICVSAGVTQIDTDALWGVVWGFEQPEGGTARQALQALMLRFGFDAVEREGLLRFRMRDGRVDATLDPDQLALSSELDGVTEETRASEAEMAGRIRIRFVEAEADFETIAEEAALPEEDHGPVAGQDLRLSMLRGEGRQVAERWLSEARIARDTLRLALPPSRADLGPGDVVQIGPDEARYRIDRIERAGMGLIDAVRIEPETYRPVDMIEDATTQKAFVPPVPVFPLFLDLPLITGDEVPHAPHIAVTARPWPGSVALYQGAEDADYTLDRIIDARATIGVTESALLRAAPGRFDRADPLTVRLTSGELSSVSDAALLSGKNLMAIGDGTPGNWELFQFRDVVPGGDGVFLLSHRLRGQLGTDAWMPDGWPAGSYVVLLDGRPTQIGLTGAQRGYARHFRIGPAERGYSDTYYRHQVHAFDGIGLKPLSPVHLRAAPQGGDLAISWIRRTRIDGDRWDGLDVPLGEEAELYRLRVFDGPTILRETTLSTPSWTYSTAEQGADGGASGKVIEVAQISAQVGAGAPARLSL